MEKTGGQIVESDFFFKKGGCENVEAEGRIEGKRGGEEKCGSQSGVSVERMEKRKGIGWQDRRNGNACVRG